MITLLHVGKPQSKAAAWLPHSKAACGRTSIRCAGLGSASFGRFAG